MTANDTPNDGGIRARNGNGQFTRSIEGAKRDAEIARLYSQGGLTFREVGAQFGISKWAAISAYNRAVRDVIQEAGEEALKVHGDRLEYIVARCMDIAETDHLVVSHGQIVRGDDGQPLKDSAPALAAFRELRGALADFRRMTGMDKPAKVEHSGGVTFEVVGVDPQDLV